MNPGDLVRVADPGWSHNFKKIGLILGVAFTRQEEVYYVVLVDGKKDIIPTIEMEKIADAAR